MDPFTLVIGAIGVSAYLVIGRLLGKLTIKEFKRETASQNLNIFQKGVRMLLFPVACWEWKDRMHKFGGSDVHCLLYVLRVEMRYGNRIVTYDASGEEAYYRVITFLWPFKLIHAFFGAIEIAFFVAAGLARSISSVFVLAEALVWRRKNDPLAISFRKKETMARLKAQQDDFDVQFGRLRKLSGELAEKSAAIESGIEHGDRVADTFTAGSSGKRQAIELVARLREKRATVATERARVEAAIRAFDAKKKELAASLELLTLYYRADELEILDEEKLAERVREEILSTLRSCAELYRQVYDAERSMMLQMNSDVEAIADHIVEGEDMAEQMERRETLTLLS